MRKTKKVKYVCSECGSDNVITDAMVKWSVEDQSWEIVTLYDGGGEDFCSDCEEQCRIKEIKI